MRPRFFIETVIFRGLVTLSHVLPRSILLGIGSIAGWLGYVFDSRHRRIALDNLRLAYGADYEPRWAHRIVRNCWRHFGRITVDSMALYRLPEDRLRQLDIETVFPGHGPLIEGRGVIDRLQTRSRFAP